MDERRLEERDRLRRVVAQWNANRLDLFELSEPDDKLEFHGVMRFYYQDAGQKVATKCIRVTSLATAQDIVGVLIEKFRPDMRMLSTPRFSLYEIHENGEERILQHHERPLYVQLNWHQDDREGRFLLRNLDEKHEPMVPKVDNGQVEGVFKRKLSKREKKEIKKQAKVQRMQSSTENDSSIAEKLYTELPETSFTRSMSNPEAVMRRRRQQKLEKKLQQFRSRDGGPDTGGTLKIYGESLCSDVPYKTLLLSVNDTAAMVVREMLNKYGMFRDDPTQFCLVQIVTDEPQLESKEYSGPVGPYKEHILEDDECPLSILMNYASVRGSVMFHVRRRPADHQGRKRKKPPVQPVSRSDFNHSLRRQQDNPLPFLVELNPDGSEIRHRAPGVFTLHLNVTEVGSDQVVQAGGQYIHLAGPNVQGRHCVLAHTEDIVTITPCNRQYESYVNGQRVYETTILQHNCVVQFGRALKFRFLDPVQEERLRGRQDNRGRKSLVESLTSRGVSDEDADVETTFDVDGNVETHSTVDQLRAESSHLSQRSSNYASYPRPGNDPILPAVLEFREETEDNFLRAVITQLDPSCLQFKLAPTYTLYMAARFRASTHYRSELSPSDRAVKLTDVLTIIANMIHDVIQSRRHDANALAFWMANSSEYLHFLKKDRHISAYSRDAQDILAESVQTAFWYLVENVQAELSEFISHFLEDRDDANEEEGTTAGVLNVLGSTMSLLRRCRVNAALTIQLFSQLFHFVNMGVFNMIVLSNSANYCSRLWGVRLKRRLTRIEEWADRLGLELAADCHLGRVVQTSHLLTAPKSNVDDLTTISSTCYKLNSLQLKVMLERYAPAPDEPSIPQELIDNIVRISENTSDELARQDGRSIRLEEDHELQLPFLLPEDGYSCDIVRGIPNGLPEFISPLEHAGMARMSEQPTSWGYWTIYMSDQDISQLHSQTRSPSAMSNRSVVSRGAASQRPPETYEEPEVQLIRLHKSNTGMGLSIVAAKGVGRERLGIYIKSVVEGGSAYMDGRLAAGDQLLDVDDQSLIGISQEEAAEYMMKTGPAVALRVAKQAAIFHGLTTLLSQPSPVTSRSSRRTGELNGHHQGRIQSSKSVPVLNSDIGGYNPNMPAPRRQPETCNPAFNLSASNTSLISSAGLSYPQNDHLRSRSVQNLGGSCRSPQRPTSSNALYHQNSPAPKLHPHHLSTQHHSADKYTDQHFQAPQPIPPSQQEILAAYQRQQVISPNATTRAIQSQHVHMNSPGGGMARSVSEHEHLRYRPTNISSQNNLLSMASETPPGEESPPSRPPPPRDSYRESPSSPSVNTLPHIRQNHPITTMGNSVNRWDRQDSVKEVLDVSNIGRHRMDKQIDYLESISERSKPQQQQLDVLLLEKRFQERLEMGDGDDDDEQDSGYTMERPQQPLPSATTEARRAAAFWRQEEMRRKQAELEAAHQAEKKLLREAQRRRQMEDGQRGHTAGLDGAKRLDSLLQADPPAPPERSVSFSVMAQAAEMRPPAVPPKPEVSMATVVGTKRVQFHEPASSSTPPQSAAGALEKAGGRLPDPADQLATPASMHSSAASVSSTEPRRTATSDRRYTGNIPVR